MWPLDSDSCRGEIHDRLMRERVCILVDEAEDDWEYLCCDRDLADQYFQACVQSKEHTGPTFLLQVSTADPDVAAPDGYDIAGASGGSSSLIESELITPGRNKELNGWGLFPSIDAARGYLANRSDPRLEDAGSLLILGITVLTVS